LVVVFGTFVLYRITPVEVRIPGFDGDGVFLDWKAGCQHAVQRRPWNFFAAQLIRGRRNHGDTID
jgi:hypothetical protein